MKRATVRKIMAHCVLIACSSIFIIPFVWLVSTSLKPDDEIFQEGFRIIPSEITFEHYIEGIGSFRFLTFLKNTLIICAGSVFGTALSCSLAAYGFSIVKWKGRDTCFYALLATMMLPPQDLTIATVR